MADAAAEAMKNLNVHDQDGSDSGVEEDGSPRKASQDTGTPKKDINGAETSNSTGEKSPGKKIANKTLPVSKIAVAKSSSVTKTAVSKTASVTSPDSPRSSSSTTRISSRLAKSTISHTTASSLNGKLTPSATPSATPRPDVVSPINSEGGTPKCGTPRTLKSPVSLGLTPDLKNVRSKVGSTHNIKHKPGGGAVKIVTHKVDFSHVSSKCGSTDNIKHKPGGGVVKIESKKLDFSTVGSKVGSKDNIKHRPTSSSKKIETVKLDFKEKAQSKVGSLDNVKHQAGGGDVQILNQKLDFKEKARAKVDSLNTKGSREDSSHSPGVGNSEDSRSVTSQDTDNGQNEELLCEEKSVNSVTTTTS